MKAFIDFNTDKKTAARNEFYKDLPQSMVCFFEGKYLENVRNKLIRQLTEKDDDDKMLRMLPKLIFNGIQKTFGNYHSYTIEHNEILMDKPTHKVSTILELSKLLEEETFYNNKQACLGQGDLHLHYMGIDSFVLVVNTN